MMVFRPARRSLTSRPMTRGEWDKVPRRGVVVCCPGCGSVLGIERHAVDRLGNVSPSCVCPIKGCGFHDRVKLDGWVAQPEPALPIAVGGV